MHLWADFLPRFNDVLLKRLAALWMKPPFKCPLQQLYSAVPSLSLLILCSTLLLSSYQSIMVSESRALQYDFELLPSITENCFKLSTFLLAKTIFILSISYKPVKTYITNMSVYIISHEYLTHSIILSSSTNTVICFTLSVLLHFHWRTNCIFVLPTFIRSFPPPPRSDQIPINV